jgi:hypothetical protein
VTDGPYVFDPRTPRDRPLMRVPFRPWHRTIDPGVEDGEDDVRPDVPPELEDILRFVIQFRNSLDPDVEEMAAVIESTEAMVRHIASSLVAPDRPGSGRPPIGGDVFEIEMRSDGEAGGGGY